jgi:hypothetical protein
VFLLTELKDPVELRRFVREFLLLLFKMKGSILCVWINASLKWLIQSWYSGEVSHVNRYSLTPALEPEDALDLEEEDDAYGEAEAMMENWQGFPRSVSESNDWI